ncbi:hypothetical protein [Sideroxydans sp. CL21]|nr:hypothetical protein [Sideroxydans sp. CL21]
METLNVSQTLVSGDSASGIASARSLVFSSPSPKLNFLTIASSMMAFKL